LINPGTDDSLFDGLRVDIAGRPAIDEALTVFDLPELFPMSFLRGKGYFGGHQGMHQNRLNVSSGTSTGAFTWT
jgi:hypothetical protein